MEENKEPNQQQNAQDADAKDSEELSEIEPADDRIMYNTTRDVAKDMQPPTSESQPKD